jgi:hypothetical protein
MGQKSRQKSSRTGQPFILRASHFETISINLHREVLLKDCTKPGARGEQTLVMKLQF